MSNLMRLYFPVDLTGNLVMIEMLVLREMWTEDLPIFNFDALTSMLSRQAEAIDSYKCAVRVWRFETTSSLYSIHAQCESIYFLIF